VKIVTSVDDRPIVFEKDVFSFRIIWGGRFGCRFFASHRSISNIVDRFCPSSRKIEQQQTTDIDQRRSRPAGSSHFASLQLLPAAFFEMTIMFVVVQWFSGCCCGWPSLSSAYSSSSRRTRASSNSLIILAALLMILCSSQLIAVSEVRFSDPTNVHLQVQHLQVQQPQHFVASNSSAAAIGDVAATR
jgi:hypothetical protein